MNDILKTYMERFRENRHTLRRYTAFVLALAMITTLFVNWQLHGVGISMTAQYQCGEEEHTHTADCYTKVLTCGYEEGELENADEVAAAAATSQPTVEAEPAPLALEPQIEFVPHEHTEDCYTEVQTLTCMEEEHVHGDDCFDPEDGSLICDKFEHTHDESCYTTEYELTCGLEEGELVEQVVEPTQSAELAAMAVAEPVALEPAVDTVEPIYHHHTDACYEEVLTCPLPEHHHTVACLSDTSADVETPEEWQAANAEAVMTGNWDEDLLSVAKTQLGYEQSEKNFEIDPADGVTLRYYSRYGQSYGNPYGEWDVMFLSYCLKYAGIPQSAIPQEASVLSLRSSMSDMDWLLDGEDGSAANVGDIVIYNKYVTRTVAVDSSADGAADDLDDQFSMDAEGENGAELETSGASALDAAPAAEDAPAADSVITPDLPDTANPEQPAAKPVDSTGTSASGADTLIPSVVSPAAEPQTTTVTDAEPVETVGIVSSVDSDAGTLTVISGDVDGKVAEVTLFDAEVLAVVDVAAAQYAAEYGSQLPTTSASSPNREPNLATDVKYLDYFEETKGTNKGGITKYTFKIDNIDQTDDFTVTVGQNVNFNFNYHIDGGVLKKDGYHNTLTYHLPKELWPATATYTDIHDRAGHAIGKQVFYTTGITILTFDMDSPHFNPEQNFDGEFSYTWEYREENATEEKTFNFPGSGTKITLEKSSDIDITKKAPSYDNRRITETADGRTRLQYEVIVSSKNGWTDEDIWILDNMRLDSNIVNAEYDKTSFKVQKVASDDSTTDVDASTYKIDFTRSSRDITFKITNLGKLGAGEKYILTYDVLTTRKGSAEIENTARTNNNRYAPSTVKLNNMISKTSKYNEATDTITWRVSVRNNSGSDLKGYVFTDKVANGAKIKGEVELHTFYSDDTPIAKIEPNEERNGFTYTFPEGSTSSYYQFIYETDLPDTASHVSNEAWFEYKDGNNFYTNDTYTVPGQQWSTEKTASGQLTLKDANNPYIYEAPWEITVNIPRGGGDYRIDDYIQDAQPASHYGIAADLQKQIEETLTITYTKDGKTGTLYYKNLQSNGIGVSISYYGQGGYHEPIQANDTTTKVRSIYIYLYAQNCTLALGQLKLQYKTLVDVTNVPEGQRVTISNSVGSSKPHYEYQKPSAGFKLSKQPKACLRG